MAHTSPPSFFISRRRGARLTIASALPETGGVTHFGLCVLAVGVRISDCSSGGGRDRGGAYVSIWRKRLSVCSRKRAQEAKLTVVVGALNCSSSRPSIPGVSATRQIVESALAKRGSVRASHLPLSNLYQRQANLKCCFETTTVPIDNH